MADINDLMSQLSQMGLLGGLSGMGGNSQQPGAALSGLIPSFIAKSTYALNPGQVAQDASAGALKGATSAGKNTGMQNTLGTAAGALKQSGLLPKPISSGLSGAASGAQLGALGGPIGTGIGAGLGGLAGLFGGKGGSPNARAGNISVSQIPMGGMGGM